MFKTQLTIAAHPDLNLQAKLAPLAFEIHADGSFALHIGEIAARCDAVPIAVTIPFLRRGRGRVIAGEIGPFGVQLKPVEVHVRGSQVGVHGVLGKEHGVHAELRGVGACKAEIEASGKLPVTTMKAAFEGIVDE